MGDEIEDKFNDLIAALKAKKSSERSEKDRYIAIVVTELEKAYAVYCKFIRNW